MFLEDSGNEKKKPRSKSWELVVLGSSWITLSVCAYITGEVLRHFAPEF